MNTIRIKICGVTRPEDALTVAEVGADAVGLVFYVESKCVVTAVQAKEIAAVLPPLVSAVALSVNEQPDVIRETLHQVPVDVIQFHGDEDDDFYRQFDWPYLRAVRMQFAADIQTACAEFPNARALLPDAYRPTEYGNMGQSLDQTMLLEDLGKPWILAGGLTPENVTDAVRTSGAAVVDVSGGAESLVGIRGKEKMVASVAATKVVRKLKI